MVRARRRNIRRVDYNEGHIQAIQLAQAGAQPLPRRRIRPAEDRDEAEEPPRRQNRPDPLLEVFHFFNLFFIFLIEYDVV